jgi:hypothetical protein
MLIKPAHYARQHRVDEAGTLYFTIEYTVRGPRFRRHNVAAYAARCGAAAAVRSL